MVKCGHDECNKQANFGIVDLSPQFCVTHKLDGMIDVKNPKCECLSSQPRWNFEGLSARFCSKCKSGGMIEVNRKKCCCKKTRPCFNFDGLKAEFCAGCKSDGMINVIDKRCVCKKLTSPSFNFEGLPGKYCNDCKLDGMINVRNPTCFCGSAKPNFGLPGSKQSYCSKCKTVGMVDVAHHKCKCGKAQPHFNYVGLQPEYCSKCKLSDMIDVSHKLCVCGMAQPTYNIEGLTAKYCSDCKSIDMVDVKHSMCKTLYCNIRTHPKYEGYCFRCFIHTFPDKPISRNYKTKEFSVVEYIKTQFPGLSWITDKIVKDGCSSRRPDLLLDLGYQIIIIEVDENQHKKYDCSCNNKRIMELSLDNNHRPVIFIRFNPDDYINQTGDKVKSCWSVTKQTGILKIGNKKEWTARLDSLKRQIEYWIHPDNKTDKTVETVQLYYDENLV